MCRAFGTPACFPRMPTVVIITLVIPSRREAGISMPIDWSPFVDFVRRHQRFLLTTHVRPDGDGLGSMLALDEVLRRKGKQVQLAIASSTPPRYRFLDPAGRVQYFRLPGEEFRSAEAILVLDTGTWNQLGDFAHFLRGHNAT